MSTVKNIGDSWDKDVLRRTEQGMDQVYESFCELLAVVKKGQDIHFNLNKEVPVTKLAGVDVSKEKDLRTKKMEIQDLKMQIQELQDEIKVINKDKLMKQRAVAQCCKLITGLEIAESEQKYVGMSVKDPSVLFAYDTKDPQVTSKLWKKVEGL